MKNKALTYQEFIALADKNYCKGGMTFSECWDESAFQYYVEEFGAITERTAMRMFKEEHQRNTYYNNCNFF